MEEISSQNSDLGLEDLDKLEAKGRAENTKRATSWRIKKFEKWCDKRKLKVDFNCVTPVELNELLRKFYAEVKSEKGQTANTKYSNWYSSCDPPTIDFSSDKQEYEHYARQRISFSEQNVNCLQTTLCLTLPGTALVAFTSRAFLHDVTAFILLAAVTSAENME